MDADDLRTAVEDAVRDKLEANEAFTTADISHPLIKQDKAVRHRDVRTIINDMDARGEMAVSEFETSMITVYPQVGQTAKARLWHPSDFDPNDYKGGHKVLVRSDDYDSSDDSGSDDSDDSDNAIVQNSGVIVSLQNKHRTVNIPPKLVRDAGLHPGDRVAIEIHSSTDCNVKIIPDRTGKQIVDKEGRIRLHGTKAVAAVSPKKSANALIVNDEIRIG